MFHSGSGKEIILKSVTLITANVNELAAMMRACNSGGAYNIFRDIDRDSAIHYGRFLFTKTFRKFRLGCK